MNREEIGARIVAAVGEAGSRELLDALTRPEADRAALIGRLAQRADGEWLAELLIDLEEGGTGAAAPHCGVARAHSRRGQVASSGG